MMKKYINIGYVLFALYLVNFTVVQAQEKKDSLVNVAFGTVAKEDLLGAVSIVNVSELMKKSYSTWSLDGISSFVGGYNGNIWGQGGLVLVDGIPRNVSNLRSSEIESITVLKGASAVALYGSRAAKGVVLITTKRGEVKPLSIDVRANTGMFVPKAYPKYLDAANYMTYYNEARINDGLTELYTQETIDNTASGINPYRYPDIDFFSSEYLKKAFYRSDFTGEISGGSERTRYYTNFGAAYNNSLMNYGEQKKNNNLRLNIRANVDMRINEWLTATTDAVVIFNDAYRGRGDFWGNSSTLRTNWISPLVPISMIDPNNEGMQTLVSNSNHIIDGQYLLGGQTTQMTNVFGDMLASGYIKDKSRVFMISSSMTADLGTILQGLSFKALYGAEYNNFYSEAWNESYAVYEPGWSINDSITSLTKLGNDTKPSNESVGSTNYEQTMTFSSQFYYKRTFNENHNISAAFIGWGYQTQVSNSAGSTYHRTSNVNLGLQAAYNFRHKYYFDFTSAIVRSAKLPEGKRSAFSPTFSIGWRLSDENFFKDNISFVNNLKFSASYANIKQDIDISEFYMYQADYNPQGGWYQWRDGVAGGNTTGSRRAANPNLTFIQREEFRIGMDAALFNNLVTLDANYFVQYTKGLLTTGENTVYPSYFRSWDFSFLPNLNFNEDKRTGLDFTLNIHKKIGQFENILGFSGMIYSTEATRRDEYYEDSYQYSAGKPIDAYWGFICEGFFKDDVEIGEHASQNELGQVKPGDLKYKDVNGDDIIDVRDRVNLGHNGWAASPFTFGVHYTVKWKNLKLFVMGTGSMGAIGFKNSSYYWNKGNSKYSEVVLGRWTEETAAIATYPRLTTTENTNNFLNSTFWIYKTNRFDLSRVQITYDFPEEMFKEKSIKALSVYFSGESLLTISKERKLMETNIGREPQYRFYNLGVKASF